MLWNTTKYQVKPPWSMDDGPIHYAFMQRKSARDVMVSSISIKERMGEVVNRQAKERDDYTKSKPKAPFA